QIGKSLAVNMVRVTKDGITYNAAQNAPSLPAGVGQGVHAIIGLQPFRQAHKHSRKCAPAGGNRADMTAAGGGAKKASKKSAKKAGAKKAAAKGNAGAPGPSPNIQNAPPYLVREVLKAYNADGLSVTGKGQTIAILIDTFPADSDLKLFWKQNNLPTTTAQITMINVKNTPLPAKEGEETHDVEWASGIAPGAKIRVYASG